MRFHGLIPSISQFYLTARISQRLNGSTGKAPETPARGFRIGIEFSRMNLPEARIFAK
jgi:hypothetical protein